LTKGARKALAAAIAAAIVLVGAVAAYKLARARLFPKRYRKAVTEAAEEFGLDPLLVAAVIHNESRFRPAARSSAGARGLMQLMPATAADVAGKLELDGYSEAMLEDPQVNLRLGCAHLRELLDRFGGNEQAALAAYNAGRSKVLRWLEEAEGDTRRMLRERAFPETRRYVRNVLSTRRMLRRLDAIDAF
jgi:soluble lytic murein transglycosylase